MTAESKVSLYTKDYYDENQAEIDSSSNCGNVAEFIDIDNYTYASVKATEYPYSEEGEPIDYRNITVVYPSQHESTVDESILQSDLTDLRSGTFNSFRMIVDYLFQVEAMQRTPGDSVDHVTFERFTDPIYGGRWRLILTNRDSVDAFSIKVYNNAGSYLYTPGSFIDQGDGSWMVESSYTQYDDGDVNFDFILGSAPITQVYHVDKDKETGEWDISYFTEI